MLTGTKLAEYKHLRVNDEYTAAEMSRLERLEDWELLSVSADAEIGKRWEQNAKISAGYFMPCLLRALPKDLILQSGLHMSTYL